MNAKDLTQSLGGRWRGRYGTAPCPVCQSQRRKDQDALTLADSGGRLLLHCKKGGCGFTDILAAAGVLEGDYEAPDPAEVARREAEERAVAEKKARQAARCWREAQPIEGTVAEAYLRGRGITCALPGTLRFHAHCWHAQTARRYPAMVGLVEGADRFAIHRTYLSPDGTAKATIQPAKAMLGGTAGGAVRLASGPGGLVVAEGIETALSLASGLLKRPSTVWAALSTSGLRGLRLPQHPGRLTIAPDGDQAGREAAHELALRAHGLGWEVFFLEAPEGRDWNDVIRKAAA